MMLNDYLSAIDADKIAGDSKKEEAFKDSIVDDMESIKEKYIKEKISYDQAKKELLRLNQFDSVKSEYSDIIVFINRLETSRNAYKNAEKLLGEEKYYEALKEYERVIEEDSNYTKAQSQLIDVATKYKEYCIKEAGELAAKETYSDAVSLIDKCLEYNADDVDLTTLKTFVQRKGRGKGCV